MQPFESGKSRAQRIRLDYYRQPDEMATVRRVAILVAVVAAGAYALFSVLPIRGQTISSGPLAEVHAAFENDCQACHSPESFSAISSDAWRFDRQASLRRLEVACQKCHRVASHFRELQTDPGVDQDCSSCHHEHCGRLHNLTRVSKSSCTQCHADLAAKLIGGHSPRVGPEISAFTAESHGDFRSLQLDPGQVHFDHDQHLQLGQVPVGTKGGMRLRSLSQPWRNIYRKNGQTDDNLVQLSCTDCHQANAVASSGFISAADSETGRHHEPIQFESHCAGCHELNYVGRTDEELPLPHAVPWQEIRSLLTAKIESRQHRGQIRTPYEGSIPEPVPGSAPEETRTGGRIRTDDDTMAWIVANVKVRCLLCHEQEHLTEEFIRQAQFASEEPLIPRRWLQRGIFDHAAHRKMDCAYCHPMIKVAHAASDRSQITHPHPPANDHDHVMIRGIKSCTGCHRPEMMPTPPELLTAETLPLLNDQPTWASDRCMLCHRYHWTRPEDPKQSDLHFDGRH